ncbi:MAG: hypothetical protein Q9207_000013 [Kuettlingeria erythrocarpa]
MVSGSTRPFTVMGFSLGANELPFAIGNESGASNETMTMVYAIDGILIDLYGTAWQNATAALDATNLPGYFAFLADHLDPRDRPLVPDYFVSVDPAGDDRHDFFLRSADGFTNTTIINCTISGVEETKPNID